MERVMLSQANYVLVNDHDCGHIVGPHWNGKRVLIRCSSVATVVRERLNLRMDASFRVAMFKRRSGAW
jgi:hypothetical protein